MGRKAIVFRNLIVVLAILSLGRIAAAQTLRFDPPLSVTKVELPLNHPPVDLVCADKTGKVTEQRYWQKDPNDDGIVDPKLRPGQVVPSCDKVTFPKNPPLFVTCSAYSGFDVKERQFEGDEGDDDIAIIPKQSGSGVVPCDDKLAPGEFSLKPALGSEAFMGALGDYVFVAQLDDDGFQRERVNVFRADAPGPIAFPSLLLGDPTIRLTRVPGGFDLHFITDASLDCGVDGANGAICLARLERKTGAKITRAQCLKALPEAYFSKPLPQGYPVAIAYPALLSVRGTKAVLRATGPGVECIAQE
jgi:hypothetical protein